MTWEQYRRKLNAAGWRADIGDSWVLERDGKIIRVHPHDYRPQPDGTTRTNWRYWAEHGETPPPF